MSASFALTSRPMSEPDDTTPPLPKGPTPDDSPGGEGDEALEGSLAHESGVPIEGFGPPEKPGDVGTLGSYRIIEELGAGAMGVVYRAIDKRLNRDVALKVMLPEAAADPTARERFLR